MDAKGIMNPKYWMVGIGSLMLVMSVFGVMDGEQMAADMWGEDNVAEHDAEYEEMWALNMMPLFAMFVFYWGACQRKDSSSTNYGSFCLKSRFLGFRDDASDW